VFAATRIWGGSDFLLIPHCGGKVVPSLLQAAVVHDPDHVVLLRSTVAQHELLRPGSIPVQVDGKNLAGDERKEQIERAAGAIVADPDGEAARDAVAAACSPYRHRTGRGQWTEDTRWLNADGTGARLTLTSDLPRRLLNNRSADGVSAGNLFDSWE
jgi:hypothetical protein